MHRRLALAIALLSVAVAAPAPAGAATRTCGELARQGERAVELVTARASGVRCRRARTVLGRHIRGLTTAGWACDSAGSEALCTRGARRASYRAARRVRACGNVAFAPQSDFGAFGIVAKRATCRTARAVARASEDFGPDPDRARRSYRARGFRCAGFLRDEALLSVLYTCRRGKRTVAFSRS